MGMRATFAVITAEGTVMKTSVQWSTVIHRTIAQFVDATTAVSGNDVEEFHKAFTSVVSEYDHISCVDVKSPKEDLARYPWLADREEYLGYGVVVNRNIADRRNSETDSYNPIDQIDHSDSEALTVAKNSIREFHLDGGSIGVILDEKTYFENDGELEFFKYADDSEAIEIRKVTLSDLWQLFVDSEKKNFDIF